MEGDITFGMHSLYYNTPSLESIETVTDCVIYKIPIDVLNALYEKYIDLVKLLFDLSIFSPLNITLTLLKLFFPNGTLFTIIFSKKEERMYNVVTTKNKRSKQTNNRR